MDSIRKNIIFVYAVLMIGFCVGCSSQDKPSVEEMKSLLMNEFGSHQDHLKFTKFDITNSVFKTNRYCVEIAFTISDSGTKQSGEWNRCFGKRDNKWYLEKWEETSK
jgi:hypothetical protein